MTGGLGARLSLVRDAPGFRLLFAATLTSSLGTWLAVIALVVDVYDRTGNASWVSALLVAEFLPIVLVGLLAGPLIDAVPRRSILVGSDLARLAVFCALPFAGSTPGIVLLALAAGMATSFFRPALYAALPNLVDEAELPRANGLLQSAENLTWALGALAGGALVAVAGTDAAYSLNAATFLLSALLLVRIRGRFEEEGERGSSEGPLRELAAGFRVVLGSRALLTVLVAWSIVMLAHAGVNVAEVVFAKDVFGAGDFGYGLLVAAGALGLVFGSLYGSAWIEEHGMRAVYASSIGMMAIGFGTAAAAPSVWVAAAAVVLAGVGNGAAVVCNAQHVQRGAPDHLRGRAFTVLMGVGFGVLGLGMAAAGPLANEAGARAVWGIAAALLASAAAVGVLMLRGVEQDTPVVSAEQPLPAEESPRAA